VQNGYLGERFGRSSSLLVLAGFTRDAQLLSAMLRTVEKERLLSLPRQRTPLLYEPSSATVEK
jgi:hypothetical protein